MSGQEFFFVACTMLPSPTYCRVSGLQRKLAKLKTWWKNDDEFTSRKEKSQTRGHRKIPVYLLSVLQPPFWSIWKTGRRKIDISGQWNKYPLFEKPYPTPNEGGVVSLAQKIRTLCVSLPEANYKPDPIQKSPNLACDHFSYTLQEVPLLNLYCRPCSRAPGSLLVDGGHTITVSCATQRGNGICRVTTLAMRYCNIIGCIKEFVTWSQWQDGMLNTLVPENTHPYTLMWHSTLDRFQKEYMKKLCPVDGEKEDSPFYL